MIILKIFQKTLDKTIKVWYNIIIESQGRAFIGRKNQW